METSIFKYLPIFKILLYKNCPKSYCIPSDGIATHLREFHKDILTKEQRATTKEPEKDYNSTQNHHQLDNQPAKAGNAPPGILAQSTAQNTRPQSDHSTP